MRRIVIFSSLTLVAVGVALVGSFLLDVASFRLQAARLEMIALPEIGDVEVIETVDSHDEEAVNWARERYQEARLSIPAIRVSFHNSSEPCNGSRGGHRIDHGLSRVFICISEGGPTRELKVKRTLLHEFAHAWDAHFVTDDVREEFLELRGLEEWSFEVPYEQRGMEHAAETITWGLMDEPIVFGSYDAATPWEAQYNGYVTLTGTEPPHGYVWSLFAASHDVYAQTPTQVEIAKRAWELSGDKGRLTEKIGVRFLKDEEPCNGALTSSELVGDRLHIEVCPGSESALTAALLDALTGG